MGQHQQIQRRQQGNPQPFTGKARGDPRQVAPGTNRAGGQGPQQRQHQRSASAAHATAKDQRTEEDQAAHRQPLRPVRHVRHRPGQHALVLTIGIEQSPVAADRALGGRPLPGLVDRLDQVVADPALGGASRKLADEARLVDDPRLARTAHSSRGGPAGFADHHGLAGEARAKPGVALQHLGRRLGHRRWSRIVPVRQQMDGQEVHGRRDFRVLEPELPDVGISDRLFDLAFDLINKLRQLRAGDFLAQQGFVADDHRASPRPGWRWPRRSTGRLLFRCPPDCC